MIFGEKEKEQYEKETECWICTEEFDDTADKNGYKKNGKVRDHCHYTGRYRGAAHNSCNILYRKPDFIIFVVMIATYLLKILVLLLVLLTVFQIMRKNILAFRKI